MNRTLSTLPKRFVLVLLIAIASTPGAWAFDHAHTAWAKVLKASVVESARDSRVDYQKIKTTPADLNDYLAQVEAVSAGEYLKFSNSEKIAFLINSYNAQTVKLVVDHYPVKSIRKIGGLFSNPWKMKFFSLIGEKQSLDHIEHEILRKNFEEPRIHFALVCASKSCPPLRNVPYLGSRLEKQLSDAETRFLTDPVKNRIEMGSATIYLSSIFKWYGGDFEKKFGSLKVYLGTRMTHDPKIRAVVESPSTKIEYLDYDWSLNGTD